MKKFQVRVPLDLLSVVVISGARNERTQRISEKVINFVRQQIKQFQDNNNIIKQFY